jgi:hypothetical protein
MVDPNNYIHIEPTKEEAKEYHDRTNYLPTTAYIYTDGSGIDGNIGAAAVFPKSNGTRYQYLGKRAEYNVYAAELCAIQLGLEIIKANRQYRIRHVNATTKPRCEFASGAGCRCD